MGVRWASNANNVLVNTTVHAAAETVVLRSNRINLAIDSAQVLVWWYLVLTCGATITAVRLALYQGTDANGTLINTILAVTTVGASTVVLSGVYPCSPGIVAEQQFTITLDASTGAGDSTVQDGAIAAMCL